MVLFVVTVPQFLDTCQPYFKQCHNSSSSSWESNLVIRLLPSLDYLHHQAPGCNPQPLYNCHIQHTHLTSLTLDATYDASWYMTTYPCRPNSTGLKCFPSFCLSTSSSNSISIINFRIIHIRSSSNQYAFIYLMWHDYNYPVLCIIRQGHLIMRMFKK